MCYDREVKAPKAPGNILIVSEWRFPFHPCFLRKNVFASAKSLSSFIILNVAFHFSLIERHGEHIIFRCTLKPMWQSLASQHYCYFLIVEVGKKYLKAADCPLLWIVLYR
jgi:hypothetical protein